MPLADSRGAGTPVPILHGIRVVDVGSWIAAPAAATVMSDFGAEVIKVEPPGRGDPYRDMPLLPGLPESPHNYGWLLDSRNKKSLALDLKVPEAQDVLRRLVATADVFITNFPPVVLERWRLRWEDLAPGNERLVYAWLTGYGDAGPEADRPGFDINAWWARSGLMDLVRPAGAPPTSSAPGMGDHPTSMALFGAIMLALYQRERTGHGLKVSTSLMANGAWANAVMIQAMLCGATFVERPPREQARNALANSYRCRDGRWFILTLLREDKEWAPFLHAIGRPELAQDARFATTSARRANSAALVAILDEHFAGRDWAEWRPALVAQRITFEPVAGVADLRDDAQMALTEVIVPVPESDVPGGRLVMSPIHVSGHPKVPPRRAPEVGEHSEEVLRSLGYDAADLARFRAAGGLG